MYLYVCIQESHAQDKWREKREKRKESESESSQDEVRLKTVKTLLFFVVGEKRGISLVIKCWIW